MSVEKRLVDTLTDPRLFDSPSSWSDPVTVVRRRLRRRRLQQSSLGAVALLVAGSAAGFALSRSNGGGSDVLQPASPPPSSAQAAIPSQKPTVPPQTLRISVLPATGPPGTLVHITVTGCADPSGQNHAVSFNNDSQNFGARNNPATVRDIPSRQEGDRLIASYRIAPADKTGGVGQFTAQCAADVVDIQFTVK